MFLRTPASCPAFRPAWWWPLAVALLTGCGGASDAPRTVEPPPASEAPRLAGTVATGAGGPQASPVVKGRGTARAFPGDPASGRYDVTLQGLAPPYAAQVEDGEDPDVTGVMTAVTPAAGTLNVTPLSAVAAAYTVGQAPQAWFDALGDEGGSTLDVVTDERAARGERRARQLLADWGLAVPAAVTHLSTQPFDAVAGDPMHDLIVAFRDALIARDTPLATLLQQIGERETLCRQEQVAFVSPGREDEFCPSARRTGRDGAERLYSFDGPEGDRLEVRTGDAGTPTEVTLLDGGTGARWRCAGRACAGVTVGDADAEGRRTLVFDGARLSGATGAATLDGRLRADAPGVPSPEPLSCVSDGGTLHALLSASDTFPGACQAAGTAVASGPGARTTYLFSASSARQIEVDGEALSLRVHADGTGVLSVMLYRFGEPFDLVREAVFKCGGDGFAACTGARLDAAAGGDTLVLDDTVLQRVGDDGTAQPGGDTATLRAPALRALPRIVSLPPQCDNLPDGVALTVSDGGGTRICPDQGNGDIFAGPLGDETQYTAFPYLGSGNLSVYTAPGALVPRRVEARREADGVELFVCDSADCLAGVTLTRAADGRTTIRFQQVGLKEREAINTAGDRTATLTDGELTFAPFE